MSVKIMIAGEFAQPMYEKACKDALTLLGWRTSVFEWFHYFEGVFGKIQHKYSLKGPHVSSLNRNLTSRVLDEKPDILLVWLGIHVEKDTLETIKRNSNTILVSYVHDDPFSSSSLVDSRMALIENPGFVLSIGACTWLNKNV